MSARTLIYDRLIEQHRQVSDLLSKMKATASDQPEERQQLLAQLRSSLLAHAHAEEEEVYPRFRRTSDSAEKLVRDDLAEHGEIEEFLETLSTASAGNPGWLKKLKSLEECIDHHVGDEENELFPEVREHLSAKEARSICRDFDQAFGRHLKRLSEHNGDLVDMTKDELYELAREFDLKGRSEMKKDDLIYALRH